MTNDPILQALSARVRYAAILIRKGRYEDALKVLEQCERVLPLPERRNWMAAKTIIDRHYKQIEKNNKLGAM